jgi:hypothetical protein
VASPARSHFALWTGVKVVVAAVLVFLLARIAIPDLVNAHDTPLLLLAVVLGFVTLGIVIWTVISIRRSYRRLHAAGTGLIEARK